MSFVISNECPFILFTPSPMTLRPEFFFYTTQILSKIYLSNKNVARLKKATLSTYHQFVYMSRFFSSSKLLVTHYVCIYFSSQFEFNSQFESFSYFKSFSEFIFFIKSSFVTNQVLSQFKFCCNSSFGRNSGFFLHNSSFDQIQVQSQFKYCHNLNLVIIQFFHNTSFVNIQVVIILFASV